MTKDQFETYLREKLIQFVESELDAGYAFEDDEPTGWGDVIDHFTLSPELLFEKIVSLAFELQTSSEKQ